MFMSNMCKLLLIYNINNRLNEYVNINNININMIKNNFSCNDSINLQLNLHIEINKIRNMNNKYNKIIKYINNKYINNKYINNKYILYIYE